MMASFECTTHNSFRNWSALFVQYVRWGGQVNRIRKCHLQSLPLHGLGKWMPIKRRHLKGRRRRLPAIDQHSQRMHSNLSSASSAIKASVSLYWSDVNVLPNCFDVPDGLTEHRFALSQTITVKSTFSRHISK